MHDWSDDTFDWKGLDEAISYIDKMLRVYGRLPVMQAKEKWGTARIYTGFGWSGFHSITHPGHAFRRYPVWLWKLDILYFSKIFNVLNYLIVPFHQFLYKVVYQRAVNKWPHLFYEITDCADWHELLSDIPVPIGVTRTIIPTIKVEDDDAD